jgi:predicted RNA-binding protein YlxR (DUF448 family)
MEVFRMCVSCRARKPKTELIRITANQNGAVIDQKKQCAGRAIYVCKNEHCIEVLKKSNAIKRLLQTNAEEEFYNQIKIN